MAPLKDIRARRGRQYIDEAVARGENGEQDFKYVISDARKIARSISAFANADGGSLLIGVRDNGTVAGVRNEEDIYMVEQAAQRYCRPEQTVEFTAFRYDAGIMVIRATVAAAAERPVSVVEEDGHLRAYVRVADENIAAHPLMVRAWRARGRQLHFGPEAAALAALVRGSGIEGIMPEDIPTAMHISRRTAGCLIVRLAAAGIIEFVHLGRQFRLIAPAEE